MPGENAPPIWLFLSGIVAVGSVLAFLYFVTNDGAWADFVSWLLRRQRPGPFQQQAGMQDYDDDAEFPLSSVYDRTDNVIPRPQRESAYQPRQMQQRHGVVGLYVPMVRTLLEQPKYDFLDDLLDLPTLPVARPGVKEVVIESPKTYNFSIGTYGAVQRFHKLDHFRFTRRTGGGKSVLLARVIPQLLAQGVEVWYINPKYMPVDETGLDIQPIIDRCTKIAIGTDGRDAFRLLMEAKPFIQARIKEAQETKRASFGPVAIIVEELQTLMELWNDLDLNEVQGFKRAAKRGVSAINVILATGRQPKVFYGTTSQDAQVQNTGVNTGIGNNFGISVMHPSLDRASLSNLTGGAEVTFPEATGPYQWYVFEKNGLGNGAITMVDVPMVENAWVIETLQGVPVVDRNKQVEKDSPPNQSEPLRVLAEIARDYFDEQRVEEPEDVPEERDVYDNADLVRAAAYMANNPNPSQRELAKHLFGKNGGRWNVRAGLIMTEVRRLERKVENGAGDNNSTECEVGA